MEATGRQKQIEDEVGKDTLAASRRRAHKQGTVPEPGNRTNFKIRRQHRFDTNQEDYDKQNRDRNNRVHGNAQIAMASITFACVNVHHLSNGEKREKN